MCNCSVAGSVNRTCDSADGDCLCKEFVEGDRCDACVAGFSFLEAINPSGCSAGGQSKQNVVIYRTVGPTLIQFLSNRTIVKTLLQDTGPKGLCQLIQNSVAVDKGFQVKLPANKFFTIAWLLTIDVLRIPMCNYEPLYCIKTVAH